jgi:hypothetical protein
LSIGFVLISETWLSVYFHYEKVTLLIVYVDDFKMCGSKLNVKWCWGELRKVIDLSEPQPTARFLGCNHKRYEIPRNPSTNQVGADGVFVYEYEMKSFMKACVEKYQSVVGGEVVLKHASTPFLTEAELPDREWTAPGVLGDNAASVLMKILYGARAARWDVLRQVCYLAGFVSKWMVGHDRLLFRLVCYIW